MPCFLCVPYIDPTEYTHRPGCPNTVWTTIRLADSALLIHNMAFTRCAIQFWYFVFSAICHRLALVACQNTALLTLFHSFVARRAITKTLGTPVALFCICCNHTTTSTLHRRHFNTKCRCLIFIFNTCATRENTVLAIYVC